MITESEIRAMLKKVLRNDSPDEWDLDFDFTDDAVDSLDRANLALLLEESAGHEISDQDLARLTSIRSVQNFLLPKAA